MAAFDAAIAAVARATTESSRPQNEPLLQRAPVAPAAPSDARGHGNRRHHRRERVRRLRRVLVAAMAGGRSEPPHALASSLALREAASRRGAKPSAALASWTPAKRLRRRHASLGLLASGSSFSAVPDAERLRLALYTSTDYGPLLGRGLRRTLRQRTRCATINGGALPDSFGTGSADGTSKHPGGKCQCNKGITRFHVRLARRLAQALRALRTAADVAGAGAARELASAGRPSSTALRLPLRPAHRRASRQLPEAPRGTDRRRLEGPRCCDPSW